MENIMISNQQLITDVYAKYRRKLFSYIYYKINNREEAEDLVQETFLRLMDYKGLLCEETVRSFVMTIALNLVTDYLRRHYKKQEITTYLYDMLRVSYTHVGSSVITSDLQQQEVKRMTLMPVQRKKIYYLNRFEGKNSEEISQELGLSVRTVENHLYISRKEMREYIRKCI